MTPSEGAVYGAGAHLIFCAATTLWQLGKGPQKWGIRVYPFQMIVFAAFGAVAVLIFNVYVY